MHTRYIYCYRWKATGRAAYVGSAWDVEERDNQHTENPNGVPFDTFMLKYGRDKFALEIVEKVVGKSKVHAYRKAIPRENFWMDKLKTWHEHGGQNFMRATLVFSSEEQHEAFRAWWVQHGKRTGRIGGRICAKNKLGFHAPGQAAKGGRIGGRISGLITAEKKLGIHAPEWRGVGARIGGRLCAKKKLGFCGRTPKQMTIDGQKGGRKQPIEAKSRGGRTSAEKKLGIHAPGMQSLGATTRNHNIYHVARGVINPSCKLCRKHGRTAATK